MTGSLGAPSPRRHGAGIDQIPLPGGVPGELWLCGKHDIAGRQGWGSGTTSLPWSTIVCLAERHELEGRYPEYAAWLDRAGDQALWWPIPDLHAPTLEATLSVVDDLADRLRRGDSLLVHCGAGFGRAGTTAVCVLIRLGVPVDEAERVVADHRPMAGPEVGAQRDLVRRLPLHHVPGT